MQASGPARTIVAIGEVLWDQFPDGRQPGGAPCNVAFHATRLGDRGSVITRVGDDAEGSDLVGFLHDHGVLTECVQRDDNRPTGTVGVTIEDSDPRFTITEDVAWDYLEPEEDARALTRRADAICVGSLAQRSPLSRATIQELLSLARDRAWILFDVNLRPPFIDAKVLGATLRLADVVKLSESEVDRVSTLLDRASLIPWLLDDLGVRVICVTRGSEGASISTRDGTLSVPGVEIDSSAGDAVGAGDAFTAAMAHQLVREATPEHILEAANRYAALIATKRGAMPDITPDELAEIGL